MLAGLAAGAALAQPTLPYPQPPRPRAEPDPGAAPAPNQIWQPGYWMPGGRDGYAWMPGRWVPRPGKLNRWVTGRYAWGDQSWVWIPPHWE